MEPSNITEFPQTSADSEEITLDKVVQRLANWRTNKTSRGDQIPDNIWKSIFVLEAKFPDLPLHVILGITKLQFQRKRDESSSPDKQPDVDFCELKEDHASYYQPVKIPATNTLVVEFCRGDGKVMKIHTTTDSFAELMKAFYSGG